MPVGEFIAEIVGRAIFELIFFGFFYWTGFAVLKAATLGQIRLARITTARLKNRKKEKWWQIDWSIWLEERALKAEVTCIVGFLFWAALGAIFYYATK